MNSIKNDLNKKIEDLTVKNIPFDALFVHEHFNRALTTGPLDSVVVTSHCAKCNFALFFSNKARYEDINALSFVLNYNSLA